VKEFVREYGKPAAIFAAAAFVLSFLIGLFSGNFFGTVLFRAFLLGIAFGAIGVGVTFVVKKYLPELSGVAALTAPAASPEERHSVDITLQDETPIGSAEDAEELESAEAAEPAGPESDAVLEPAAAGDRGAMGAAAETDGEYELTERDAVKQAGGELEAEVSDADKGFSTSGNLEPLPVFGDLGSYGGFSKSSGAQSEPVSTKPERPRPHRPINAAHGSLEQENPESLAKAIRTIIKRDERG
jgi:hypothetical protein